MSLIGRLSLRLKNCDQYIWGISSTNPRLLALLALAHEGMLTVEALGDAMEEVYRTERDKCRNGSASRTCLCCKSSMFSEALLCTVACRRCIIANAPDLIPIPSGHHIFQKGARIVMCIKTDNHDDDIVACHFHRNWWGNTMPPPRLVCAYLVISKHEDHSSYKRRL